MTTLSIGEAVLLRLPDGTLVSGHISSTYDFIADSDPDHNFTD